MVELIQLLKTDDFTDGEMRKIDLGDLSILIVRKGDEFYAVNNKCPHMGGDLSQGTLDGTIITCPVHHSQFDVTTGQVIRWTDFTGFKASISKLFKSPKPLTKYEIEVEDDQIFLKMETP